MRLKELIKALEGATIHGVLPGGEVRGLVHDSRRAGPGLVFAALKGVKSDGHDFVEAAARAGALAALVELPVPGVKICQIEVENSRAALAALADRFNGSPSRRMSIIGVTGTNGKTTVSYLIESILLARGPVGVVGTVEVRYGGRRRPAAVTTPEPVELQGLLAEMRRAEVGQAVMEVSSHALCQHRADAIAWDAGVFLNLTRDHLDFHADMDEYFAAKERLFCELLPFSRGTGKTPLAVINLDSDRGAFLAKQARDQGLEVWTFGVTPSAKVRARKTEITLDGVFCEVVWPNGEFPARVNLAGHHNLENLLAAAACCLGLGFTPGEVARGLENLPGVPGRLERVTGPAGSPRVFVDYAHTGDALASVLSALAPLTKGRLICVFGAGGDRDPGKRPLMGRAVAAHADLAVLTSDNPRSEDPLSIMAMIRPGLLQAGVLEAASLNGAGRGVFVAQPDRARAIALAVASARKDDVVLVAGKGHEDYQEVKGRKRHFDDREEAASALAARGIEGRTVRSRLDDAFVTRAVGVNPLGAPPKEAFSGVSSDSRTIRPGELFVALEGPNFDGHEYVAAALESGAGAALVREGFTLGDLPAARLYPVGDTLEALGGLAAAWRREFRLPLVAITGSNGKSTSKEMLAAVFAQSRRVLKNPGNLNNLIGLPLTLLKLAPGHGAAVVEMGMNAPGEIARLTQIAAPSLGLITNVGPAHLGPLGSVQAVAKAKSELFAHLPSGATAAVNLDDPLLAVFAEGDVSGQVTFGFSSRARVRAKNPAALGSRQVFTLVLPGKELRIRLALPGRHNIANALGAAAAAWALGVDPQDIVAGLESVTSLPGRLTLAPGPERRFFLDDTYNANPASLSAGLRALKDFGGNRRKVLILGDMRELGETAPQLHRQAGAEAVSLGCALVLALGERAEMTAAGAREAGLSPKAARSFSHLEDLLAAARELLAPNDVILVKGSRSSRMERVVQALSAGEEAA